MIEFNRPRLLHNAPSKSIRRVVIAFNRPTVSDPSMVFTHHIELHAWISRLYFGCIAFYWNPNPRVETSDAYARYSSRLYRRDA